MKRLVDAEAEFGPVADTRSTSSRRAKAMQPLFAIDDVFDIAGRGCILAPGIPHSLGLDVKAGAPILIVSPDGVRTNTRIAAFEMIRLVGLQERLPEHAAFSVPRALRKEDLKIGSMVYLLNENGA